jgi:hypothetical protein
MKWKVFVRIVERPLPTPIRRQASSYLYLKLNIFLWFIFMRYLPTIKWTQNWFILKKSYNTTQNEYCDKTFTAKTKEVVNQGPIKRYVHGLRVRMQQKNIVVTKNGDEPKTAQLRAFNEFMTRNAYYLALYKSHRKYSSLRWCKCNFALLNSGYGSFN